MTLWALLSDIHGNLPALQRAVEMCREQGAERFAFLGDLLGRGDSDGVVALARRVADVAVVGNRDLDWAGRVSALSREYVLSLPRRAETETFVAVHGDPRLDRTLNVAEVRRGASRAYLCLRERSRQVLFFGHTHQARVWRKGGAEVPLEIQEGPRVALEPERGEVVYVVNVGTVGLPFPGKGPPSCTLFEDGPGRAWIEIVTLDWRERGHK